jgi:hypothetical protein
MFFLGCVYAPVNKISLFSMRVGDSNISPVNNLRNFTCTPLKSKPIHPVGNWRNFIFTLIGLIHVHICKISLHTCKKEIFLTGSYPAGNCRKFIFTPNVSIPAHARKILLNFRQACMPNLVNNWCKFTSTP